MGYVTLTFPSRVSDAERFLSAVSAGAQTFRFARDRRDHEKQGRISGVIHRHDGADQITGTFQYDLEAFGPTKEWVEEIVARYLREHPNHRARFEAVNQIYDGWRARGSALAEVCQ